MYAIQTTYWYATEINFAVLIYSSFPPTPLLSSMHTHIVKAICEETGKVGSKMH